MIGHRIGYRHCDPRFPFLWHDAQQPAARWHGMGEGPANYFADTPVGAWAEFLRHEAITDAEDLKGVRRSLWAVELPDEGYVKPGLPSKVLLGGRDSYATCQAEGRSLRARGAQWLEAPSAALKAGGAGGWTCGPEVRPGTPRNGKVWVLFGAVSAIAGRPLTGWPAVEFGAPPERILEWVNHLP